MSDHAPDLQLTAPPGSLQSLWFSDRSRYFLGLQGCPTERWIEYHSGPSGYGIRPTTQAVPLATGIRLHLILARWMKLLQPLPAPASLEESREQLEALVPDFAEVVVRELRRYLRYGLRKGGWHGEGPGAPGSPNAGALPSLPAPEVLGEEAGRVLREQMALMAGLVWGYFRVRLAHLHLAYRALEVEEEGEEVVGCDCGLSGPEGGRAAVGSFREHGGRGCQGVGLSTRPDIILERRSDGQLLNTDWKSLAVDSSAWRAQWADSIQFAIGTAAAERRIGRPIAQYQVFGLVKGQRKRGWTAPGEYNGPKSQQSHFCYVEVRQANPPLGKLSFHCGGKWAEKYATWEAPFPVDCSGMDEAAATTTRLFWWTQQMQEADLEEAFPVLGPFNHQAHLAERFSAGLLIEEQEWRRRVWALHDLVEEQGGSPYALIGQVVAPSWQCHRFARSCSFVPICYRHPGWEEPLTMQRDDGEPRYELRAPHHQAEADQARERGIELPVDEEEGEEQE